jgi:multidrug efflux system membrane fusion protein
MIKSKLSFSSAFVCFLTGLFISGCGRSDGSKEQQKFRPVPKVVTWQVQTQDVPYAVATVGSLEADEVYVQAKVEGIATKVAFQEGDAVTPENPVLVEIDPEHFLLLRQKTESEKEKALANYQKAKGDYQKRKTLFKKGVTTEDEMLTFRTSLRVSRAELHQAEVAWKLAMKDEKESQVRSPISGLIQSKNISLGMLVKPETQLASLMDPASLRVEFHVNVDEAVKISLNQNISFYMQEDPDHTYQAQIFFIRQFADPQTRMVLCKANKVQGPSDKAVEKLKPGSFVKIQIQTEVHENAVVVPMEAVLTTERGFKTFVIESNQAKERFVELGLHTNDGGVEILKGLAVGETLIIKGAYALRDGMPVEVVQPSAPEAENQKV